MFKVEDNMPVIDLRSARPTKRIGGSIIAAAEELQKGQSFHVLHENYARASVRARISQLNKRLIDKKFFLCRKTEEGVRVHRVE